MAHACGGHEVVGIDFERLVAIANRFDEVAGAQVRFGPLIPGFGEPGDIVDQRGGSADGFLIESRRVQSDEDAQFLAVGVGSGSRPKRADTIVGERANGAVGIQQGAAHGVVRVVIAQQSEGEDGGTADFAKLVAGESFEGAGTVPTRSANGEVGRILLLQVFVVQCLQIRFSSRLLAHAGVPPNENPWPLHSIPIVTSGGRNLHKNPG